MNGTANVTAVETAKAAGVPRFVFVSATIPNLPGIGGCKHGIHIYHLPYSNPIEY